MDSSLVRTMTLLKDGSKDSNRCRTKLTCKGEKMNNGQLSAFWDISIRFMAPLLGAAAGGFIAWLSGRNVLNKSLLEQKRAAEAQLLRTKSEELYTLILKILHDIQYFLALVRSPQPPESLALDTFLGIDMQQDHIRMYYYRYFPVPPNNDLDARVIVQKIVDATRNFVDNARLQHDSLPNLFRNNKAVVDSFNAVHLEINNSSLTLQNILKRISEYGRP